MHDVKMRFVVDYGIIKSDIVLHYSKGGTTMTPNEQKKAAAEFAARWKDQGYEKGQSQQFWMDLLVSVFGVQDCILA